MTLNLNENLIGAYPWLEGILAATEACPTRILMVADGPIDFGNQPFGLSELLKALGRGTTPSGELYITTAHRDKEVRGRVADKYEFKFKDDSLKDYDQVWLFGYERQDSAFKILPAELKALSAFMNKGGGLFATGDHQDLGYALCGQVPRVRGMRKWCITGDGCDNPAPPRDGANRLDTLLEGHDEGFQDTDQSDNVPQRLAPKPYESGGKIYTHALLKHGESVIRVSPDHMHEGECVEDVELTHRLKFLDGPEFDEFPKLPGSEERLAPEVVAVSFSAGGYDTPVKPRCFGAVGVYEGDRVFYVEGENTYQVGRVVVDASFHHFVDINLAGTGATKGKGFHNENGNPTKDYEAMKRYFRNIADWLNPPALRLRCHFKLLVALRFMFPLIEEVRREEKWTPENILAVGRLTRKAIADFDSPGKAVECALSIFDEVEAPEVLKRLTDPWLPEPLRLNRVYELFDPRWFIDVMLGTTMISIAALLPDDPYQAGEAVSGFDSQAGGFIANVLSSVTSAARALGQVVELSAAPLSELSTSLDSAEA